MKNLLIILLVLAINQVNGQSLAQTHSQRVVEELDKLADCCDGSKSQKYKKQKTLGWPNYFQNGIYNFDSLKGVLPSSHSYFKEYLTKINITNSPNLHGSLPDMFGENVDKIELINNSLDSLPAINGCKDHLTGFLMINTKIKWLPMHWDSLSIVRILRILHNDSLKDSYSNFFSMNLWKLEENIILNNKLLQGYLSDSLAPKLDPYSYNYPSTWIGVDTANKYIYVGLDFYPFPINYNWRPNNIRPFTNKCNLSGRLPAFFHSRPIPFGVFRPTFFNISGTNIFDTLPHPTLLKGNSRFGNNHFYGDIPDFFQGNFANPNLKNYDYVFRPTCYIRPVTDYNVLDIERNDLTGFRKQSNLSPNATVGNSTYPASCVILYLKTAYNMLDFSDLEPHEAAIKSNQLHYHLYTHAPQDSIGKHIDTVLLKGNNIILTAPAGGTVTTYQWYKNGQLISGAISQNLILNNIQTTQAGIYTCQAKNTKAPALTLHSRTAKIVVQLLTGEAIEIIQVAHQCQLLPNIIEANTILSFDCTLPQSGTLVFYNMLGQEVGKYEVENSTITQPIDLSKTEKSNNILIWKFKSQNGESRGKIVFAR